MTNKLTEIDEVAGVRIYEVTSIPPNQMIPRSFVYKAKLTIDGDGSPRCYGPDNSGIDYTANGGTPGSNWWGGPVDTKGMPIVQQIYEPYPGMYVSGTSLINVTYPETSQYRYIDSESIPFFVLPGGHQNGAKGGDVGLCLNTKTGDNCYGIYADTGPSDKIGEASIRMAMALAISNDPKKGGTEDKIVVYLVFPGSVGKWTPPNVWWDLANTLTHAWGGLARLKEIAKDL